MAEARPSSPRAVHPDAVAPAIASTDFLHLAATRPVVIVDFAAEALSAAALRASGQVLADAADACLLGDQGSARVQFPPSYRTRLLAEQGVPVWAGINCRDRNRVAIEGEIAACIDAGAIALHCVTGDHPSSGHRPDATAVFDLDCVDVVELARSQRALCSVAHAPAAPPIEWRLPRLLRKIEAGADVVFIDHCGGPDAVAKAVGDLRATGFAGLVIACVPVVTSVDTALVIESFAAGRLPEGYLSGILNAADPIAAGVDAATQLSWQLLDIDGVDGVNLSGGAGAGQELAAARHLATIGRRVQGRAGHVTREEISV